MDKDTQNCYFSALF